MAVQYHIHSKDELIAEVGNFIELRASEAVSDHGFFSIGLSGGSSATMVSKSLEGKSNTEWSKWRVFFCDERFVSLSDPDSNFKAIEDGLLSKVPIDKQNVFTVDATLTLEESTRDYQDKMKSVFGDVKLPEFDLLVLGMGPDGHICSLFPGHPLLHVENTWTAAIDNSPKPPPKRITLTLSVVNNAKHVAFTVTGEGKAEVVKQAKEKPGDEMLPASMVKPVKGSLHWFLDNAAGSLL